jgi:hypothetical protein
MAGLRYEVSTLLLQLPATVFLDPMLSGRSYRVRIDESHPHSYTNDNADATFRRRIAPL